MAKKISNMALFIAGDPAQPIPSRAFVSYDVKDGPAEKTGQMHEIADVDPDQPVDELWSEALTDIKTVEGVS